MAAPRSAENNPLATKAGTDIADGLVELIAEHVEQLAARVGPEMTDVGDLAGVARVAIYQSLLDALPARIQQLARSSVDDYLEAGAGAGLSGRGALAELTAVSV